jgi:hypothetical protein
MALGSGMRRGRPTAALLACMAAGLLALAGCGSGGGGRPGGGGARPLSGSALPSWAAALGPGVSVYAPTPMPAGHGSPGGVVTAIISALEATTAAAVCQYLSPFMQASCASATPSAAPAGTRATPMLAVRNFAIGYVAVKGTQAIVGYTGTICSGTPPQCTGNSDPAAFFSSRRLFGVLWEELAAYNGDANTPMECTEVGSSWHVSRL